jgi:hypothetical protein
MAWIRVDQDVISCFSGAAVSNRLNVLQVNNFAVKRIHGNGLVPVNNLDFGRLPIVNDFLRMTLEPLAKLCLQG